MYVLCKEEVKIYDRFLEEQHFKIDHYGLIKDQSGRAITMYDRKGIPSKVYAYGHTKKRVRGIIFRPFTNFKVAKSLVEMIYDKYPDYVSSISFTKTDDEDYNSAVYLNKKFKKEVILEIENCQSSSESLFLACYYLVVDGYDISEEELNAVREFHQEEMERIAKARANRVNK